MSLVPLRAALSNQTNKVPFGGLRPAAATTDSLLWLTLIGHRSLASLLRFIQSLVCIMI